MKWYQILIFAALTVTAASGQQPTGNYYCAGNQNVYFSMFATAQMGALMCFPPPLPVVHAILFTKKEHSTAVALKEPTLLPTAPAAHLLNLRIQQFGKGSFN